jgi:1-deoxy-D-xylulose-5-phosphate synthase
MIVAAPMDELDLRNMLYTAQLRENGPFSIRFPRGRGNYPDWKKPFKEIAIGKARILREGRDIAILSIGNAGNLVTEALVKLDKLNISAAHFDMRFVKPIDEEILHQVFSAFSTVLTVEDGVIQGGFGSAVLEFMADNNYSSKVKRLGIPDKFIEHGSSLDLYKECGFDADSIVEEVKVLVGKKILSTS